MMIGTHDSNLTKDAASYPRSLMSAFAGRIRQSQLLFCICEYPGRISPKEIFVLLSFYDSLLNIVPNQE